jgi:6-phosphogluconolactonase
MAKLTVTADEPSLIVTAAERITRIVTDAIAATGHAMLCLTGGSTPRPIYAVLTDPGREWRSRIDWSRVHFFWGDERHVPPDSPDSNFKMANDALVAHVPVPPSQVHRMRGEIPDAAEAARLYDEEVRAAFESIGRHEIRFDLMLLGLGEDVHIASIFPGSSLLTESQQGKLTAGVWVEHLHASRITLTPAPILDAREILMVVDGARKAAAVHAALEGPLDATKYPAQLLRQADDRVEWLIDAPAAARLPHAPRA